MVEKRYFKNLQELRGLAALLIVMSHIPFFQSLIGSSWGGYGVTVFFLLSGFLLIYSTDINAEKFMIKRIARIIPLFWAVTIFTFMIAAVKPNWFNTTIATFPNLIKSLLFIPYVNPNGIVRPILDVSWALFPEMWMYLTFYFAMKVSYRYRGLITGSIFIFLFILSVSVMKSNPIFAQYKLSFLTLPLGMVLYDTWSKGKLYPICSVLEDLSKGVLIAIFWIVGILYNYLTIIGCNYLGVIFTIIVFILFLITENNSKKYVFLSWLGKISYSMYLIHEFIVKGFSRLIFSLDRITFVSFCLSIACLGVVVVLAYCVHQYYEEPMRKMILKISQSFQK